MIWRAFSAVILGACAVCFIVPANADPVAETLPPEQDTSVDSLPLSEPERPQISATIIPKLTPVSIEIGTLLGTKISTSGDRFVIRLTEAIVIDGRQVVPAGVEGEGEVIHAKKGGGMGSAGELVLAARYLNVDGRQLPLRSMKFVALGKDNIGTSTALGIALGLPGLLVSGGNTEVPVGTRASAMTREDFIIVPMEEVVEPTLRPDNSQPLESVEALEFGEGESE